MFEIDDASGPTSLRPVHPKENIGNKRFVRACFIALCRLMFPMDFYKLSRELKDPQIYSNHFSIRRCLRRQSARFKSEEPEQAEDLFEIEDAKFPVSPVVDDLVHDIGRTRSGLSAKKEDEGNTSHRFEAQQMRRSSVGRPLRRAAEKVQSYKETPINVKMRRQE